MATIASTTYHVKSYHRIPSDGVVGGRRVLGTVPPGDYEEHRTLGFRKHVCLVPLGMDGGDYDTPHYWVAPACLPGDEDADPMTNVDRARHDLAHAVEHLKQAMAVASGPQAMPARVGIMETHVRLSVAMLERMGLSLNAAFSALNEQAV